VRRPALVQRGQAAHGTMARIPPESELGIRSIHEPGAAVRRRRKRQQVRPSPPTQAVRTPAGSGAVAKGTLVSLNWKFQLPN
jgi:hypothetical protein